MRVIKDELIQFSVKINLPKIPEGFCVEKVEYGTILPDPTRSENTLEKIHRKSTASFKTWYSGTVFNRNYFLWLIIKSARPAFKKIRQFVNV
jgi:hypothetical protein